jgi:hypothetical protein
LPALAKPAQMMVEKIDLSAMKAWCADRSA